VGERPLPDIVFVNLPYSPEYEDRFLAIVATLSLLGVVPTAAIVAPIGATRLDRIINLLWECPASIHDLSWMELDATAPPTPRFNMPFELGVAVALSRLRDHDCIVLDTMQHRLDKALSDIRGIDPYIYDGTPAGIFRALSNVFFRSGFSPRVAHFSRVFNRLKREVTRMKAREGYASLFEAAPFHQIRLLAPDLAASVRTSKRTNRKKSTEVLPPDVP
jgi:hypothetical protein